MVRQVLNAYAEVYLYIVAGSIGVGTNLVSGLYKFFGNFLRYAGNMGVQPGRKAKAAVIETADGNFGGNGGSTCPDLFETGHMVQGAVETGGVTGRKKLLGIGLSAGTSHLTRYAYIQVQDPVR